MSPWLEYLIGAFCIVSIITDLWWFFAVPKDDK